MAREPFNRTWNEEPDAPDQYREPDNAVWQQGWRGGAIEEPPKAWYQNWWQRRLDTAMQALERLGALTWEESARYQIGAVAVASDGLKYLSVSGTEQTPNIGNDPALDAGVNWLPYYDSGIPGKVELFAMQSPPAGYLKCNGQSVSRLTYSRLFSAIGTAWGSGDGSTTFNVPEVRGEFIRVWDDGRGVDPGRAFGSTQSDAMQRHGHTAKLRGGYQNPGGETNAADIDGGSGIFTTLIGNPIATDAGSVRTSTETRPRNVAFMACIKY